MRVEIWSDVVYPWCYIGKRRFEGALQRFPQRDDVEVVWRSFELDPDAPPSPKDPTPYVRDLAAKYGVGVDHAQAMIDRATAVAAGEGLHFRFDLARRGNTFDAHRLLHLALDNGVQSELKERLDDATFTKGLAVSDHTELAALAVEAGLDEADVERVLASDRYATAVRADERLARSYGISAVPFFVIDGKYGVAGAQPPELLLEVLERAWREHGDGERGPSGKLAAARVHDDVEPPNFH